MIVPAAHCPMETSTVNNEEQMTAMMYRAVRKASGFAIPAANGNRPPTNVPYIVDNIWEWLRPDDYPSRRRSAFASPDPHLAAISIGLEDDEMIESIYAIELIGGQAFAQITKGSNPSDARYHSDVTAVPRAMKEKILPRNWFDLPMSQRGDLAGLYVPCLSKAEVEACFQGIDSSPIVRVSTFWRDVDLHVSPDTILHEQGEIFFEGPYQLKSSRN